MATIISPYLEFNVVGDGYVTKTNKKILWTPASQNEIVLNIDDLDGEKIIDLSNIDNLKIIMLLSNSVFNIKITMVDTNVITFTTDNFVLTPDSNFITNLSEIAISTTGVVDSKQQIKVNLYGEEV